ncbi:MAG: glutamine synthetase family protein [Cypionkella sp.]|nr:glutamine synthetase family protein [Cypionkella sp.]
MMTPNAAAAPAEAQAFLAAHPEIEAFDLVLTDANGIARGKIIRRHELMGLYEQGRHLPISILGLDILGEDVGDTGLVWDQGDADRRAWPIAGSLRALHATTPARGEVMVQLYELDGAPMLADPRHALAAQIDALAAMGLHPAGAFELEFYLLDPALAPDGTVRPASDALDGRGGAQTEVYSVDRLHGMLPIFNDIYAACAQAGIRAETLISEYGRGQYELTLHYRADLLAAADDLIRLKRIVRAAARAHGALACFMAKPHADMAGSGMHLHVSLANTAGENVFSESAGQEPTSNPMLRHAAAGMLAHMAPSMLVFAPHANSWRRFAANSYAPVAPTWGVNNRSVALRVPAGDVRARRLEHRPSGVDANPYLVAAAVLAALRDGIARKMTPPAPVTGNGYDAPAAADMPPEMPADWRSAIVAAQTSDFLKSALGPDLHRAFIAIKWAEYTRMARHVSALDLDHYLHRA